MYTRYKRLFTEAHYTDIFAKQFQDFRKKWGKQKNDSDLYVQFTNHNDNTLARGIFNDPNHSDPAGVYGYPLKYVIDYPADIWYGNNASFLRVLSRVSSKVISLQSLNYNDCISLLQDTGLRFYSDKEQPAYVGAAEAESILKSIKKLFPNRVTGSNWYQKAFFSAIQMQIETKPTDGKKFKDGKEVPVRPGPEQSKILLNLGYDVIIDRGTAKSAVINDREPEQVIFLRPTAFRVEEVFYLKQNKDTGVAASSDPDKLKRKLAAMIFGKLDDKLVSDNGYALFWSKAGRRIDIDFQRPDSYYQNKKMGQKKHKEDKLSSSYYPSIELNTEWGEISRTYASSDTFASIAQDMYESFEELKAKGEPSGFHETKESYKQSQEEDKQAYYKKANEEKEQKNIEAWPDTAEMVQKVATAISKPVDKILAYAEESPRNKAEMSEFFNEYTKNIGYRAYHVVENSFDAVRPEFESFNKDVGKFQAAVKEYDKNKRAHIRQELPKLFGEWLDEYIARDIDNAEVGQQLKDFYLTAIEKAQPDSQEFGIFWLARLLTEKES